MGVGCGHALPLFHFAINQTDFYTGHMEGRHSWTRKMGRALFGHSWLFANEE